MLSAVCRRKPLDMYCHAVPVAPFGFGVSRRSGPKRGQYVNGRAVTTAAIAGGRQLHHQTRRETLVCCTSFGDASASSKLTCSIGVAMPAGDRGRGRRDVQRATSWSFDLAGISNFIALFDLHLSPAEHSRPRQRITHIYSKQPSEPCACSIGFVDAQASVTVPEAWLVWVANRREMHLSSGWIERELRPQVQGQMLAVGVVCRLALILSFDLFSVFPLCFFLHRLATHKMGGFSWSNFFCPVSHLFKSKPNNDIQEVKEADHTYIRGHESQRSPCPFLNSLANHNYL